MAEFVENGVDLTLFSPLPKEAGRDVLRIICIARLVAVKRIDLLFEACKYLIGNIRFAVDIVGDWAAAAGS